MAGDADPSKWDYPAHTRAKHEMLARYLDGWFPVLTKWNGRVVFLDGFAGRGRYVDGSEGSPLIALRRLVEHKSFSQMMHREFVFLFVEANRENYENLEREVEAFKRDYASRKGGWPEKIKTQLVNAPFDRTATDIINTLREQRRNLAPTFAFVDPFGYSGLPMDLLAELLAYPRTEAFVNFMVGHVQRFIEREGQESAMRSVFGLEVDEVLEGFVDGRDNRVAHLHKVYVNQLRQRVGFDYVRSFAMVNKTGNVGYYLCHGTRHRLGVKLMKAAMCAVDPGAEYTFSDRTADHTFLFAAEPDLHPLRTAILQRYQGEVGVLVDDIEWFAILETDYRETHIRKVLTSLESEKFIQVHRPGKRGFPTGKTRIDFP